MKLALVLLMILPAIALADIAPPPQPRTPISRPPPVSRPRSPISRPRRPPISRPSSDIILPKSPFTVVAPVVIRPGKPYIVDIKGFYMKKSVELVIRIKGTSNSGRSFSVKKYVDLSRDNPMATVKIDTSNIENGNYILSVEGESFVEKRTLTYLAKKTTNLIQLNKAIFFPDELIQFRIFSIDSETRSANPTDSCNVAIIDPKRIEIKSFQDITFSGGKHENEFKLGKKASLGLWNVRFSCGGEIVSKEFEVAEYQIPLLHANIVVQQNYPFSIGKIPISVGISYTSGGGGPSGSAKIIFNRYGNPSFTKLITIENGKATFDIDIVNDLKAIKGEYTSFNVMLNFEDPLSTNQVTDSKSFTIIGKSKSVEPVADSEFIPGQPFKFKVTVKNYDGTPAPAGFQLQLTSVVPSSIPSQILTLGNDGKVSGSVDVPIDANSMTLKFSSDDSYDIHIVENVNKVLPLLTVTVQTVAPKVNEPVNIEFKVREKIDLLYVHMISKGVLLDSVVLNFNTNEDKITKSMIHTFKPSLKNAPSTSIIAYYVKADGKFVYAQSHIQFDLPNYLEIKPRNDVIKPGDNAEIEIISSMDSTVSLATIDHRVLLLKGGQDITKINVIQDLSVYGETEANYDWPMVTDYEGAFGRNGLYIISNIPKNIYQRPPRMFVDTIRCRDFDNRPRNDIQLRENFKETFLWRDVKIRKLYRSIKDGTNLGRERITEKVPESITTYMIYGVSMNKNVGIGIAENIRSITTALPFYISVDFPFSIKRDEVLEQKIFVFNNLKVSQTVVIKIKKDSKFEGVDLSDHGWAESSEFYMQTITTTVGENNMFLFALRSHYLGLVPFEITAKGPIAGDGLKKYIRVTPEGIERSLTKSVFITTEDSSTKIETMLRCNLPDSAYEDTTQISASITGDIFAKTFSNLEKLIQMPSGCGEQTMLTLAPNIAIQSYLDAANKMTPTLKDTLEKYILAGYQNELRYQRRDGSFSAFGDEDSSGSVWLSAYVAQYLYLAKDMVDIDLKIIKKAADFIIKNQNEDGSFREPGRVIHSEMQGESGHGDGLIAFCAIFLTIIIPDFSEYIPARDKAIKYLEDNLNGVSSVYQLAIIAYTLQMAESEKASEAFDLFDAEKIEDDVLIHWAMPEPHNPGYWYRNRPRSLDLEVTSFGLLTYIERKIDLNDRLKIVKYLVSQFNSFGGFSSSHDTVLALNALSQFAKKSSFNSRVDIKLTPNMGSYIKAKVDSRNTFTVQSFDLNPATTKLNIFATSRGSGLAIVSLICNFYEDPTKVDPAFEVTYEYNYKCSNRIMFDACASYNRKGTSNMAVMTITLPSGFIYNNRLDQRFRGVSQVEVTNQGSTVTFYLNSISDSPSCVTVNAYRSSFVSDLKPGVIVVSDYYDTSLEGLRSLPVPNLDNRCYYMIE